MMLATRTNAISTSAAPQACSWSDGSACSAEVKMNIGIEDIGSVAFQDTVFAANAEVKRSGAVSPATRAVANVAPVMIPPTAIGRTTLSVVRQRGAPRARLASR